MTLPKDELNKAKSILEQIEKNVLKGIWYSALYDRVAFHDDIGKAFKISFEAWGLIYCNEALLDALIVTLVRIVYGDGDNTASLDTLIKQLKVPGVFEILKNEKVQNGKKINQDLTTLENKINTIKGDARWAKIKSYRDAWVAHQAIAMKPEKHKFPKYEDPSKLLDEIKQLTELFLDLLGKHPSPTGTQASLNKEHDNAKKSSDEFWRFAAHINENLTGSKNRD